MKVVVTGSAGRLGQNVVAELGLHGHDAIPIDLLPAGDTVQHRVVDLVDPGALRAACAGAEAVIHLARERFPYTEQGLFDRATRTWSMPDVCGDSARFNRNTAMTYNVLAISAQLGLKKIVTGSSLAVYGFYYPVRAASPEYLPIDENHPRRPQDPYGLSKLVAEEICESFARKSAVQIASLRLAGIANAAVYERLMKRRDDPLARGLGSFWSYVDVRDAAVACCLALDAEFDGHEAFNICAPRTYLTTPTRSLLDPYLPGVTVAPGQDDFYCGYASEKARDLLGFRARYDIDRSERSELADA